jgi:hypothetical protein
MELSKQYHHKKLFNCLLASLKLIRFKMKDANTNIQDHIDVFNDLAVDLVNIGEDLSHERKAFHLLSSLLSFFQSLTRVLIHDDKKAIIYNKVISVLLTNDLQSKLMASFQPNSSSKATIYVTRGRSQDQGTGTGKMIGSKDRSKSRGKS